LTVPEELAALDQWVIWRLLTRKGKTTKVPHRARDGRLASTTKREDWASYKDAIKGQSRYHADGIGFVFSEDDPYCGVDLDNCFIGEGKLHPEAARIIEAIGSYAELSPSGTGVHVILKGELGGAGRRTSKTPWGGNFEVYDQGRYFTFTGESVNGLPIRESQIASLEFVDTSVDDRIIDRCRRHSAAFANLFDDGDTSEYENDTSRADLALCNMFAARTVDVAQLDRLMRQSALLRDKWDHPDTGSTWLMRRVIEPAIKGKDRASRQTGDFETDVKAAVYASEVREEARRRLAARNVPEDLGLPAEKWSLSQELQLPDLDEVFRIDQMHPVGGNVLLVAAYKSGKTTLTLNLLRALADEQPFLGRYGIEPFEGNICVVNYEETPSQWRRHVRKLGISNTDRIFPLHRRGEPILPLWEPKAQDRLVEWMVEREIAYWIMDPTVVAWQGLVDNENDNALVAAFTSALDQVKLKAGIGELMLTHHEGRLTEGRGRGATRLEDWMDAGWYLSRDDVTNQRTLWGKGRDVDLERFDLEWDEERWMLKAGESAGEHRDHERVEQDKQLKAYVYEIVQTEGEIVQVELLARLRDLGIKGDTKRLTGKVQEYAALPVTPGLGLRTEGQRKVYFWRSKK
jgi:hypothetical protein